MRYTLWKRTNFLRMPQKRRNRSQNRNCRPGSARERGNVWVPVQAGTELQDKQQCWSKFKMTKSDAMFQEMEKKFQRLTTRRRSVGNVEYSLAAFASSERTNANRRSRNSDFSTLTRPYPSGSCYTIVAGENSTFCVTSTNRHSSVT